MNPKVLIVGTVPYNPKTPSRAFEAYFSKWEKSNLFQFFSNPNSPIKGHCSQFFQITDKMLLKARASKDYEVGRQFFYDDLQEVITAEKTVKTEKNFWKKLYSIGSRKGSAIYLLRRLLWSKKYWCTDKFNKWLDDFKPDCVFLSFSDDFFIPEIALYVAERFNIPIVSSIGDDYYFNDKFSLSPFYYIYKSTYKKLIRKIFAHGGSAIYISDKIRDKYNSEFGLNGETVYLTSKIERRPFKVIDKSNPSICYFGNIRQGRNESLNEIGYALGKILPDYVLEVYSSQNDKDIVKVFDGNKNVHFCGAIPYSEVVEKTNNADIVVIVEGFKEKHINNTRYSLSTKAADSLASGAAILVYGSPECGIIEYMISTDSAEVCTDKEKLVSSVRHLLEDESFQRKNYENAIKMTNEHHNLDRSTSTFEEVVKNAISEYQKQHTGA